MESHEQPAVGKLLEVMRQFRRNQLHKVSFEGYNASMIRVLFILGRGSVNKPDGMTVSEISNVMEVTPPTVTPLIKSLEADGLVLRVNDQNDRRVVRVTLTDKGQELRRQAMEINMKRMRGISEHLGAEKTEQLADLLQEVLDYLNGGKEQEPDHSCGR
ncbi:MarR family winged helix-turn-helix transcriptional regulator [Paenibacillus pinistramenti]|uniref:MarR family winged helix-turn-helix transcriptional regulator n=1 Tax=Paenibacillus pinistramenti TaxID=1768003 RepID=UPI00110829BC|nr:MarR family transcriptional regulator [Paenibacillus pinistramenti]